MFQGFEVKDIDASRYPVIEDGQIDACQFYLTLMPDTQLSETDLVVWGYSFQRAFENFESLKVRKKQMPTLELEFTIIDSKYFIHSSGVWLENLPIDFIKSVVKDANIIFKTIVELRSKIEEYNSKHFLNAWLKSLEPSN